MAGRRLRLVLAVMTSVFMIAPIALGANGNPNKNPLANGQRTWSGTVVSINNTTGTFVLRTSQSKQQMVPINGVQVPIVNHQSVPMTFQVLPATAVLRQDGMQLGLPAISPGVHVRVTAIGNQASVVQVSQRSHSGHRVYVPVSVPRVHTIHHTGVHHHAHHAPSHVR